MKISVIVPVYNVDKYLNRCIKSILKQSFFDYELILVDDGAFDESSLVCDCGLRFDERVSVIHIRNSGIAGARNIGIEWVVYISNSEWIAFIDSDDWIHEKYLSYLYDAAIDFETQISICDYSTSKDALLNANEIGNSFTTSMSAEEFYSKHYRLIYSPWAKLFNSELFKGIRFPNDRFCEDAYVIPRIIFSQTKIAYVNVPLYQYFLRPQSAMRSQWSKKNLDEIQALSELLIYFKTNNYREAFNRVVVDYANAVILQIEQCKCDKNEKGIRLLTKILKCHVIKCWKNGMLKSKDCVYIYAYAFPRLTEIYWVLKTQVQKHLGIEKNEYKRNKN